jgi:hypothetical protein
LDRRSLGALAQTTTLGTNKAVQEPELF